MAAHHNTAIKICDKCGDEFLASWATTCDSCKEQEKAKRKYLKNKNKKINF